MNVVEKTVTIEGVSPLMVHNGQLANPLNSWAKAIKEISGKRKKTDADHAEIGRLEWFGSHYMDEHHRSIMPSNCIEAAITAGARDSKLGKQFASGFMVTSDVLINHDGPDTVEKMWPEERFRFVSTVKVQAARIIRTRPVFPTWSLTFTVNYSDEVVTDAQVQQAIEVCGRLKGLCEYRPRFGRFRVVKFE